MTCIINIHNFTIQIHQYRIHKNKNMSKLKKPQDPSSNNESTLNDYHKKRNIEGLKEIEAMLKHPYNLEQAKEQTQKFMSVK
jgi:hypothetical protein